jgi:hypothetical protein
LADLQVQVRPFLSFQDLWERRASAVRSEALFCRVSPQRNVAHSTWHRSNSSLTSVINRTCCPRRSADMYARTGSRTVLLAVPPAGRVGRWWPGRGANDQCPPASPCPWRGVISSYHELTSVVQFDPVTVVTRIKIQHSADSSFGVCRDMTSASQCTGGLRANCARAATLVRLSGSRLTSLILS